MKPLAKRLVTWTIAIVVMLSGFGVLWYRATLKNWPWQGDPAAFVACGRNYFSDGGAPGPVSYRLYPAFRAFPLLGPEVYSAETASQRAAIRSTEKGGACDGLVLFIQDSPRRYTAYSLSGGP
jgi:hypothetical protein